MSETQPAAGLVVTDLVVKYGGHTAVDGVSINAPMGRITGLIGPNGAGKTSTFNACSGIVNARSGTVKLFGRDLAGLGPHARAKCGLGRTFQRMELFDSLTVRENVSIGQEARLAGSNVISQLWSRGEETQQVADACAEAFVLCGLQGVADQRVGMLSTGQRRLVELARAIAGQFEVLMLDEPSSGLDPGETEEFGRTIEEVVARRGTGILLVEHDMALVSAVCEYLFVLDFGKPLLDGPLDEVLHSTQVQSAYLGTEAV